MPQFVAPPTLGLVGLRFRAMPQTVAPPTPGLVGLRKEKCLATMKGYALTRSPTNPGVGGATDYCRAPKSWEIQFLGARQLSVAPPTPGLVGLRLRAMPSFVAPPFRLRSQTK